MHDWTLAYDGYEPQMQGLREALCTLGNGYICTRGAFTTERADDSNYPGTYLAGGYNRLQTEISGRMIENEDLVNLPNWLELTFRPADGDWLHIADVEILSFRQDLDMKAGVLKIEMRVKDGQGRETSILQRRFVSMADKHIAAIEMTLTAENWSGEAEVRTAIDGRVINYGVKRYRELNSKHLDALETADFNGEISGDDMIFLVVQTNQSKLRIGQAARTRIYRDNHLVEGKLSVSTEPGYPCQTIGFNALEGVPVNVEKVVALYTSKDYAISEPGLAAREAVDRAGSFDELLREHVRTWDTIWQMADIRVNRDELNSQMILRLHVFHLFQTLSPNTIELDAGAPARGWHGEAYRGHVFWDELFILPYIDFRLPELSRTLLEYRYNRLPKARLAARAAQLRGAMFPWQSGSDGREESQVMHLNPRSGRWVPDHSYQQRHVNLAIAYNTWMHYKVTGEMHALENMGAELIVEIARLFASLVTWNADREGGRYDLNRVMGPDEYHEAYPDSDEPGLNNNAYTNVMVSWLMDTVEAALEELDDARRDQIMERLDITHEERERWRHIARRMYVPFHSDGVMSQYEGYEPLKEFDWAGYREKYGNIQRLDRILEAEGDSADNYKLAKQADTLMLFYLFNEEQVAKRLESLGYSFGDDAWLKHIDYYLARTSHGSTLSYLVHSWVLARSRPEQAWDLYVKALQSDIGDIQGGTTVEGIHLGLMAGTVDVVQRCLTGFDIRQGEMCFDPHLIGPIKEIALKLRYQGHWLDVALNETEIAIELDHGWRERGNRFSIWIGDRKEEFEPGIRRAVPLAAHAQMAATGE